MELNIPKQFIKVGPHPIFIHTIKAFIPFCRHIVVGMPKDFVLTAREMLFHAGILEQQCSIIQGGADRMQTITNAYSHLKAQYALQPQDIILTHDAARPFVTKEMIENSIAAASLHGACGTFLPVSDTIAVSECGQKLCHVPARSSLYQTQTPQTFQSEILDKLLALPHAILSRYTDLCGLANGQGIHVQMVDGHPLNIKITTKHDIMLATAILAGKEPAFVEASNEDGGEIDAYW